MGAQQTPGIVTIESPRGVRSSWWRPVLCVLGGAAGVGLALAISGSVASAASHRPAASAQTGVTLCATSKGAVIYEKSARCPKHDKLLSIGSQAEVTKLKTQVKSLSTKVSALKATLTGVTRAKVSGNETLTISGENVQVVNGTGDETDVDGLGNLILGYNNNPDGLDRAGSHNLVIGDDNGYSSYGGLVAGYGNLINGTYASASGGFGNTASGPYASVSGGTDNHAAGMWATVIGGDNNNASGTEASITGGILNTSSGSGSSILGGYNGTVATNDCASFPTNTHTSAQCK